MRTSFEMMVPANRKDEHPAFFVWSTVVFCVLVWIRFSSDLYWEERYHPPLQGHHYYFLHRALGFSSKQFTVSCLQVL